MRKLASKLRDQVEEAEEEMVDERQEDKTIGEFTLPAQTDMIGAVVEISSVGIVINHKVVRKEITPLVKAHKKQMLLIKGPNGIGKSTLLEALANGMEKGATIAKDVRVGY